MSLETLQAELYWAQQQLALSQHNVTAQVEHVRELKRKLRSATRRLTELNREEAHYTDAVRGIKQSIINHTEGDTHE